MPSIQDATVVNEAYSTEGNGGRKLVRLDNGWLVALLYNNSTTDTHALYVSKDAGVTWQLNANIDNTNYLIGTSMVAIGNKVGLLLPMNGTASDQRVYFALVDVETSNSATNIVGLVNEIEKNQTAIVNTTLTINEQGTELHAAWASKNSTYPNSFNIRYAKGTINGDGSVTWGTVEQVTSWNAHGIDLNEPVILLDKNGTVSIIAHHWNNIFYGNSGYTQGESIIHLKQNKSLTSHANLNSSWTYNYVYVDYSQVYKKSSPSAAVDKDGVIYVAWEGYDSVDNSYPNISVSRSTDGGVTWETPTKLTNGNSTAHGAWSPQVTADKTGKVYIVFGNRNGVSSNRNVSYVSYENSAYSSVKVIKETDSGLPPNPSTLFDPTFQIYFTEPLFIYQDNENNKVGFYGKWFEPTLDVTDKTFPKVKWNVNQLEDLTISSTKVLLNGTEVFAVENPTSTNFEYVLDEETLNNTNSLVVEATLSDGSKITKNLAVDLKEADFPLLECDVRYNFENTDGEIAEVVTWIEHDATCVPDDFKLTVSEVIE